jgi:hypothetical protein
MHADTSWLQVRCIEAGLPVRPAGRAGRAATGAASRWAVAVRDGCRPGPAIVAFPWRCAGRMEPAAAATGGGRASRWTVGVQARRYDDDGPRGSGPAGGAADVRRGVPGGPGWREEGDRRRVRPRGRVVATTSGPGRAGGTDGPGVGRAFEPGVRSGGAFSPMRVRRLMSLGCIHAFSLAKSEADQVPDPEAGPQSKVDGERPEEAHEILFLDVDRCRADIDSGRQAPLDHQVE